MRSNGSSLRVMPILKTPSPNEPNIGDDVDEPRFRELCLRNRELLRFGFFKPRVQAFDFGTVLVRRRSQHFG